MNKFHNCSSHIAIDLLKCFLCGLLFNITAYSGAAISPVFLLFFDIIYAFVQLICFMRWSETSRYYLSVIFTVVFSFLIYLLFYRVHLFYYLFKIFNNDYGEPGAGDGLGVLISICLNTVILFSTIIFSFIAKLQQKKSADKTTAENNCDLTTT